MDFKREWIREDQDAMPCMLAVLRAVYKSYKDYCEVLEVNSDNPEGHRINSSRFGDIPSDKSTQLVWLKKFMAAGIFYHGERDRDAIKNLLPSQFQGDAGSIQSNAAIDGIKPTNDIIRRKMITEGAFPICM